jgi:hypothetical protein
MIGSVFVAASKSDRITFWSQSHTYRPQHVRRTTQLDIQSEDAPKTTGEHQMEPNMRKSKKVDICCYPNPNPAFDDRVSEHKEQH